MQKYGFVATALACAVVLGACEKKAEEAGQDAPPAAAAPAGDLATDAQKFGYAIGVDLGKSLTPLKGDVDIVALKRGLDESLAGKTPMMDDKARQEIKTAIAKKMQQKQMEERTAAGEKNKAAGEQYLAENAKRSEIKTTASGLQHETVTEGKGETPKPTDRVTVHYKGMLIDGTEFDSSYSRNQPVTFPLSNVIAGWTEGLQLMKVGGKSKLYIPSALAYGERGAGAKIGPNAALVFEVELVGIEKPDAKAGAAKPDAKKADAKKEEPKKEEVKAEEEKKS